MGHLFQFMDFAATDFGAVYPEIRPGIGTSRFFTWAQLNPSQYGFNLQVIHDWIAAESAHKLADGSPKPLLCFVLTHTGPDERNAQGQDYTPDWLKKVCPSVMLDHQGKKAIMPQYTNGFWWQSWGNLVKALGNAFDGNPAIALWAIGPGMDAECWPHEDPWNKVMPAGTEKIFNEKCIAQLRTWREAFPNTTLVANYTPGPGGTRRAFFEACKAQGIGYHWCGMGPDTSNAQGWGNEWMGSWDAMVETKKAGLPVAAESTFGMGSAQHKYWGLLAAAAMGADYIDVHPDWLKDVPAERWNWITAQVGKPVAESSSVWVVLRDYDRDERTGIYAPKEWTSSTTGVRSGLSGWRGNWGRGLTCDNADAPRVWEEALPETARGQLESRQCRRITSATFEVDPQFAPPPYRVTVRWLCEPGAAIAVDGAPLEGVEGAWCNATATAGARQFSLTGNGAAVHMVTVEPVTEPPEPPEPPAPVVDWAAMLGLLGSAQLRLDSLDAARGELQGALCDAQVALTEVEAQRNAAYADLAALRAMVGGA